MRTMGSGSEGHLIELAGVPNAVRFTIRSQSSGADVLTRKHITLEVHGNGVMPIHAALLSQAGCRPFEPQRIDEGRHPIPNACNAVGLSIPDVVKSLASE